MTTNESALEQSLAAAAKQITGDTDINASHRLVPFNIAFYAGAAAMAAIFGENLGQLARNKEHVDDK